MSRRPRLAMPISWRALGAVAAAGAALSLPLASSAAVSADVSSTFDGGTDGWLVSDISSLPGAGSAPVWDGLAQRISTSDIATWTTFSAPASFLGNRSINYGGSFSFQLMDGLKDANADSIATFGIAAGVTSMFWFGGSPSTTELTSFAAGLSETDTRWRIGGVPTDSSTGSVPTAVQFQAVLSSLTMIRINADWKTAGDDPSTLDNVSMNTSPVPEPGTWALLAAGLAALGWRARAARRASGR